MKLIELFEDVILLEYREYLDMNEYGSWIDPTNKKVYHVPYQGHMDFLRQNSELVPNAGTQSVFANAYLSGWIRVEHETGKGIDIEGTKDGIKKAWRFVRPTVMHMDEGPVIFDVKIDPTNFSDAFYKKFSMPLDRRDMNAWLNSL